MAPHGEPLPKSNNMNVARPPRLSSDHLQRTVSDISFDLLTKEATAMMINNDHNQSSLPPISEVEDAKCECCGMCEECTPEYIDRIRGKYNGKFVCGLCSEAVKEEMEKNNGGGRNNNNNNKKKMEEALNAHMSACVRFNKFGRAFPVLFQAEAMKEMLKKSHLDGRVRAKSISPKEKGGGGLNKGGLARSSSCIPAITREFNDIKIAN